MRIGPSLPRWGHVTVCLRLAGRSGPTLVSCPVSDTFSIRTLACGRSRTGLLSPARLRYASGTSSCASGRGFEGRSGLFKRSSFCSLRFLVRVLSGIFALCARGLAGLLGTSCPLDLGYAVWLLGGQSLVASTPSRRLANFYEYVRSAWG